MQNIIMAIAMVIATAMATATTMLSMNMNLLAVTEVMMRRLVP